ncbi:unnamed protein product [Brassicogethes aeneus]|uniref:Uncharacterized protein n=1 Tax=Brassicogethes aeneus TaxID=1431903 RepID=A0A9P0B686_BRAAE|nr:unnamed protein product [Brassicogethes aeneus]
MRVYRVDGTFIDEPNDTRFGWNLDEIIVDESQPNYEERNREYRKLELMRKNLVRDRLFDSTDSDTEPDPPEQPIIMHNCVPKVHSNTTTTSIGLEGSGITNNFINFEDIDSKIPSKEELMNLINPCNVESRMLLAVISFAKYKTLKKEEVFKTRPINQKTRNFKLFLNDEPTKNFQNELHQEIENYHNTKEENLMSLMMELVLNDIDCKISDITELNTSDLGNSIHSNSSSNAEESSVYLSNASNYLSILNRDEVMSSLGLSDEDKSIQSICDEAKDMQVLIRDVKSSFRSESCRVHEIMQEATKVEKNLKETIFLNNLLHLLNGDLDKVKLKSTPFKMLLDPLTIPDELNLIV